MKNERLTRREFVCAAATAAVPFVPWTNHHLEPDDIYNNYMPHKQVLTFGIVSIVSQVTNMPITADVVEDARAKTLARRIRQRLGCIQVVGRSSRDRLTAQWLAGDGSAQRLLRLEAFCRDSRFSVQADNDHVTLTAEV